MTIEEARKRAKLCAADAKLTSLLDRDDLAIAEHVITQYLLDAEHSGWSAGTEDTVHKMERQAR